jgi:hypothetical protein
MQRKSAQYMFRTTFLKRSNWQNAADSGIICLPTDRLYLENLWYSQVVVGKRMVLTGGTWPTYGTHRWRGWQTYGLTGGSWQTYNHLLKPATCGAVGSLLC